MYMRPDTWLDIVSHEYLEDFVRSGGAAVKFVVLSPDIDPREVRDGLRGAAEQSGFQFAFVDSASTKIHLVDKLFHEVARQVDWDELAYCFLSRLLSQQQLAVPGSRSQFKLSEIAQLNQLEEQFVLNDVKRLLGKQLFRDYNMSQEFRLAMIRLCLSQLDPGDEPELSNAIHEWLRGELRLISSVKRALIFQRIARHNARHMLFSLGHWLKLIGKSGLALALDVSRVTNTTRPVDPDGSLYYSTAATLDAYEVLRQFIDATDELEACFIAVIAAPDFLSDDRRGLRRYHALQMRISDEVRDKHRPNPLSSLLRLSSDSQDVSPQKLGPRTTRVPQQIQHWRAIEALRSGVPNRDAVQALRSAQPQIEQEFRGNLQAAKAVVADGNQAPGLLIAGEFGSGKSHLLEYLQHLALEENFVCSRIVISKETPLYDTGKLYRSAVQAAMVPNKKGSMLTEIASSFNFNSQGYVDLYQWVNRPDSALNSRFPASLFLYEQVKDPEIRDRIISFWSGDPLSVTDLRNSLRAYGEAATYKLEKVSAKDLALQRFAFVPRLIVAAGYSGWVLFVDEMELIGRYSFKPRARSYAELARWAGRLQDQRFPGLTAVFAITPDFARAVLEERNDLETVPGKLRASGQETDRLLASQAERGMRLILKASALEGPDRALIDRTYEQVRAIHGEAYQWQPPSREGEERLTSKSMREYVRRWINEWDLKRLYPGYEPDMEVRELKMDYSENPDLEAASEPEAE